MLYISCIKFKIMTFAFNDAAHPVYGRVRIFLITYGKHLHDDNRIKTDLFHVPFSDGRSEEIILCLTARDPMF